MDKYEYRLKTDHIRQVMKRGDYQEAAKLCDTIDWNKVRDVKMLTSVADIYAAVDRYQEAIDALIQAYEYAPLGRRIVYRLTELALMADNYEDAKEYFDEFCRIAPHDQGRYILLYRMACSQRATVAEKIKILEAYKREDFDEKWAYELATLYARNRQVDDCIQLCDDIILWFGLGKYVERALALKERYAPLTEEQKAKVKALQEQRETEKYEERKQSIQEIQGVPDSVADLKVDSELETVGKVTAEAIRNIEIEELVKRPAAKDEVKETDVSMNETRINVTRLDSRTEPEEEQHAPGVKETVKRRAEAQKAEAEAKRRAEEKAEAEAKCRAEEQKAETQKEVLVEAVEVEADTWAEDLAGGMVIEEADIAADLYEEAVIGEDYDYDAVESVYEEAAFEMEIQEMPAVEAAKEAEADFETNLAEGVTEAEDAEEALENDLTEAEPEEETSEEAFETVPESEEWDEVSEDESEDYEPLEAPQDVVAYDIEEDFTVDIEEEEAYEEEDSEYEEEYEEEDSEYEEEYEEEDSEYESGYEETESQLNGETENEGLQAADGHEGQAAGNADGTENSERKDSELPAEKSELNRGAAERTHGVNEPAPAGNTAVLQVNPSDLSKVWHFAVHVSAGENPMETTKEYIRKVSAQTERPIPSTITSITGSQLNGKDLVQSFDSLLGKTIIVLNAGEMEERVIRELTEVLEPSDRSLLMILVDDALAISRLFEKYSELNSIFTTQFMEERYTSSEMMQYANSYAERQDSVLDKSAELYLLDQAEAILNHPEKDKKKLVEKIINQAIEEAEKKTLKRSLTRVFSVKYDREGRLILLDKHFKANE